MQLIFRYSCMGAGKSTNLLQVAYNYNQKGFNVLLAKPKFDDRDGYYIYSRLGIKKNVDFLIKKDDNIFDIVSKLSMNKEYKCLLVDEVNFLTKEQARQLWRIAVELDILVIAYGVRVDYRGEGFDGSKELLTLAHKIEELKTVDESGKKCTMHLRSINGKYVFDGDPHIVGDIQGEERYESCTADKWLREYNKYKKAKLLSQIDYRGGLLSEKDFISGL